MDLDKLLQDNPGSPVFSRYAEQLAREGRIEEAMDILKRGIAANPYHAPGYSVMAEILFQLDSEETAVEHLLSSVRLDPQMPRDLFRLGAYYREQEPEKAEPFIRAARQYEPDADELDAAYENFPLSSKTGADLLGLAPGDNMDTVPGKEPPGTVTGAMDLAENGDAAVLDEVFGFLNDTGPDALGEAEALESLLSVGESGPDTVFAAPGAPGESRTRGGVPETEEGDVDESRPEEPEASDAGGMEQDQYPQPFDERPLDVGEIEEADDSLENKSWEVFDESMVKQTEEELDFFDVISEVGTVHRGVDDLDEVFHELDRGRNLDVPISETEGEPSTRDITESLPEEELDSGGDSGIPAPQSEEDTESTGQAKAEERDSDGTRVMEINEDEEYNLANFGFNTPADDDVPVLSEAERAELMALAASGPGTADTEAEDGNSAFGDLTLDALNSPADEAEPWIPAATTPDDRDRLSEAELAVLSGSAEELPEADSADFAESENDGIDYSDILSAWKLSDESTETTGGAVVSESPELSGELNYAAGAPGVGVEPESPVLPDSTDEMTVPPEEMWYGQDRTLSEDESALIRDFLSDEEPVFENPPADVSDSDAPEEPEREERVAEPAWQSAGEPEEPGSPESESLSQASETPEPSFQFVPASPPAVAPRETASVVSANIFGESLEDLISAYQSVLDSPGPGMGITFDLPPESGAAPVPEPPRDEPKPRSGTRSGNYTATMAEIYASQGLLTRAMEIFETLILENPGNERYRTRLDELRQIREQQTDE